ncbi:MAG: flagellar motor switch protein FliN [Phycisphaera sp.]|nr:MAG: flagellar motor switch protein FliN [Phycisphaera sp.]
MPEERPEETTGPEPADEQGGAQQPEVAGDGADQPDEASEALKAAKDALESIQAEADAAASGGSTDSEKPADGDSQTMANEVVEAALQAAGGGGKPLELPDFDLSSVAGAQHGLDMLADVQLDVRIELGRTRMLVEDVLRLNSGAVVELDKLAGDPLDVYVNDRLVARGEVLVLNDNFCIRVNEIIDSVGEHAKEPAES